MGRLPGIDISHYQGIVDFDVLATTDTKFSICKASEYHEDSQFQRNWSELKRVNITRGAYHLLRLDENIQDQVFLYLSVVNFEPGDLPPVLDIEPGIVEDYDNPESALAKILEWLETAENLTKATPILYISPRAVDLLEGYVEGLEKYWLWDVDYENPEPGLTQQPVMPEAGWTIWTLWQWTSKGDGKAHGMESTNLDMNYFNGCRHDLEDFVSANTPENPWNIDVDAAIVYNDSRDYPRQTIYDIITLVAANPWYERDIIYHIANWQYNHGGLTVDGKVGPATYQAMVDAGLGEGDANDVPVQNSTEWVEDED